MASSTPKLDWIFFETVALLLVTTNLGMGHLPHYGGPQKGFE